MKINLTKIVLALTVVLSILVLYIYSSKGRVPYFAKNSDFSDFDQSLLIKPEIKRENAFRKLQKLDSFIADRKLSIQTQLRVYDYKRYIYEVFLKDYEKSHSYADSAIGLLVGKEPKIHKEEYAIAYLCKGDVYFSEEKFNEAFAYYYKAEQLGVDYFDDCSKSEYSYRIAMIYYKQSNYDDAKNNFIVSFRETEHCKSSFDSYFRSQQILSNIGLSYYHIQKYDSAVFYFNKALKFIKAHSNLYPEKARSSQEACGVVYGNLGNVYYKKNNVSAAKRMFKRNVHINLNIGYDVKHAQSSYLSLTELYLQENELDSALLSLKKVKLSIDTISTLKTEADWDRLMWLYFESNNNIAEAHKYLKQFQIKKDRWEVQRKSISNVDLKKQYDLFEKQNNLELLEAENKLKNIYLYVSVFISVVVFGFLIYLWLNWKETKKFVQKLYKLNKTILLQNNELENAFNSLNENNIQKERLHKLLAHDLRAPIASLILLVDLVVDVDDESEKEELLSLMKTTSVNAMELISETLKSNVSEFESKQKIPVLINDFVRESSGLLVILADDKKIKLIIELPRENVTLPIFPEKLKRVLNNLVINAVKFSPKGSTIKIKVSILDEFIEIAIQDQGIGIAENKIENIFSLRTAEYNRSGTEGEQSYGLGLPFCKQVVLEHSGTIWVESREGEGSTFYIKLPLEK